MIERYFDNAATTPLDPRVLGEMLPYLKEDFGNAHSLHSFGRKAEAAVQLARERVAALAGAEDPSQIVFTSGATESNNWVLRSFGSGAVSPYEHASVLEVAKELGFKILKPHAFAFEPAQQNLELLSVMSVNNETGALFDVRDWRRGEEKLHADATQAVGKVNLELEGIDYLSFSSHKMFGPKGLGALYFASQPLDPIIVGGDQENGLRGGTLNVPSIVGFGAAAAIAAQERESDFARVEGFKQELLSQLRSVSEWQENGGNSTSPFILSLSFAGIEGETLVIDADHDGFAISSGAACSSRSTEPSHVLIALGLEPYLVRGTVRVSFGRFNTMESVQKLGRSLLQSVEKLRTMSYIRS